MPQTLLTTTTTTTTVYIIRLSTHKDIYSIVVYTVLILTLRLETEQYTVQYILYI